MSRIQRNKSVLFVTKRKDLIQAIPHCSFDLSFFPSGGTLDDLLRFADALSPDVIFFFGTSIILNNEFIERFNCYNIHCSLLPYCRGPAPHVWSFLELVPPAITIHKMGKVIDGGDIVIQRSLNISYECFDLNGYYHYLHIMASVILFESIEYLLGENVSGVPQELDAGSRHSNLQFQSIQPVLSRNLNTNLLLLREEIIRSSSFEIGFIN